MKSTLTLIIFFFFLNWIYLFQAAAQKQNPVVLTANTQFGYDGAGNRIERSLFPFKTIDITEERDPEAEKTAAQYGLKVFPNPLVDGSSVTVGLSSLGDNPSGEATMYVLDNTGKILFSQKMNIGELNSGSSATAYSKIDLSHYSGGMYFLKISIGSEELFYRLVKTK